MKTKFKVSELPHAYMNGAAFDGATAGESAQVNGERLHHTGRVVAASFLRDARHADGRRVVVIAPQYSDTASRWSVHTIRASVPASLASVVVESWPHDIAHADYTTVCESAAGMVWKYTQSIERAGEASIHSADDTEGTKPEGIPHYAETIRALLALTWCDAVAHANATREWERVRDRWQLADDGEFSLRLVRSIAQRSIVEKAAREALPMLRGYFGRRESVGTLRDRLSLVGDYTRSALESAMSDVFRAGIPSTDNFPANMLQVAADDFRRVDRAQIIRKGPEYVAAAWRMAAKGDRFHLDGERTRHLPARFLSQLQAALAWGSARAIRQDHKNAVHTFALGISAAENAREFITRDGAGTDEENANATRDACGIVKAWASDFARAQSFDHCARRLRNIAERHPLLQTPAALFWADDANRAAMRTLADAMQTDLANIARRAQVATNVSNFREQLALSIAEIANMPRRAHSALSHLESRAVAYNAAQIFGDTAIELRDAARAAKDDAYAARENVTELQEWENGGAVPSEGDWLQVKGHMARTTRGAEVPTRAIRAAFAWLDSQPMECRAPDEFRIGHYALVGRDAAGTVTVGCHHFSAESVAHIRAQLTPETVGA